MSVSVHIKAWTYANKLYHFLNGSLWITNIINVLRWLMLSQVLFNLNFVNGSLDTNYKQNQPIFLLFLCIKVNCLTKLVTDQLTLTASSLQTLITVYENSLILLQKVFFSHDFDFWSLFLFTVLIMSNIVGLKCVIHLGGVGADFYFWLR